NNLGATLFYLHRFTESEQMYLSALKEVDKSEQRNSPKSELASVLSNMAMLYRRTGRYSEAEKAQMEALSARKTVFGERSSAVAVTMTSLAETYRLEGDFDKATQYATQAVAILDRPGSLAALGDTLTILGVIYHDQGKMAEAESANVRAVE